MVRLVDRQAVHWVATVRLVDRQAVEFAFAVLADRLVATAAMVPVAVLMVAADQAAATKLEGACFFDSQMGSGAG